MSHQGKYECDVSEPEGRGPRYLGSEIKIKQTQHVNTLRESFILTWLLVLIHTEEEEDEEGGGG